MNTQFNGTRFINAAGVSSCRQSENESGRAGIVVKMLLREMKGGN